MIESMNQAEHAAYKEIMIQEASRDARLRGVLQWILFGSTDLLPLDYLEKFEEAEIMADVAHYYGLDSEEIIDAQQICKEELTEQTWHGQA